PSRAPNTLGDFALEQPRKALFTCRRVFTIQSRQSLLMLIGKLLLRESIRQYAYKFAIRRGDPEAIVLPARPQNRIATHENPIFNDIITADVQLQQAGRPFRFHFRQHDEIGSAIESLNDFRPNLLTMLLQ